MVEISLQYSPALVNNFCMEESEKKRIVIILTFYFPDDGRRTRITEDAKDLQAAGLGGETQEDGEDQEDQEDQGFN